VHILKMGRMAGPDGIRGELARQVSLVQLVMLTDGGWGRKHVNALSGGYNLHDCCSFSTLSSAVPTCWGAWFLS
jgi:hypothetical protein